MKNLKNLTDKELEKMAGGFDSTGSVSLPVPKDLKNYKPPASN